MLTKEPSSEYENAMSKANPFPRMSRKGAAVLQLSTFGWCQTILQNQQTRPKSLLLLSTDCRKLPMRPRTQEERVQGSAGRARKHLGHFFVVLIVPSELAQAQSRIYHFHSIRMCIPNFVASWTKQHSSWQAGWGHIVMSAWLRILSLLSHSIMPRNVSSKRTVIFAEGGKAMLQYPKDLQYDSHICVCQKPPTASASVTYTSSTIGSIHVVQTAFTAAWTWHKTFSPGSSLTQNNNYSGHLVSGLKWQNQILSPKAKKAN